MACKSCKKNNGNNTITNIIDANKEINNTIDNASDNHELFDYEKLLLTIFGWVPLGGWLLPYC